MSHHSHTSHAEEYHSHFDLYKKIFGALVILTVITVAASRFNFAVIMGPEYEVLNIIIAMLIASVKASLVALFFMHLKGENATTWVYAAFPIVLMFVLIAGVFTDNPFRTGASNVGKVDVHVAPDTGAPHAAPHR